MSHPLTLVEFLTARVNEAARNGAGSTQTLKILLDEWDNAHGTLERIPVGYAHGLIEGIRIGLLTEALHYTSHLDYDQQWRPPTRQKAANDGEHY